MAAERGAVLLRLATTGGLWTVQCVRIAAIRRRWTGQYDRHFYTVSAQIEMARLERPAPRHATEQLPSCYGYRAAAQLLGLPDGYPTV